MSLRTAVMRSLAGPSVDGILTLDEAGTITSLSPAAERIFGCSASEAVGRDLRRLLGPGQRGSGPGDVPVFLSACTEPVAATGRRCNGETFPIDLVVYPLPEGERARFVALVRDAGAWTGAEEGAHKAHARLLEAVESMTDGFLLYDAEDRLVLCNTRARGLLPGAADLLTPGRRFEETVRAMVETGQVPEALADRAEWIRWRLDLHRRREAVFKMRRAEGRWLRVSDSRTREGGAVCVIADITETKNREAALEEAKSRAERASRAKSEFLASISHEMRTPLNAIIGFSEVMKTEALGPIAARYREYAADIHDSGSHLLALINDILDLSKVESGQDRLREETVDIPLAVRAALRLVRQRADQGKIRLEADLPAGLPALRGDRRKVRQILVNLMSNAIKFTEPGGTVVVTAACDPCTGHVIRIADTGIGIAPEDVAKVLARFQQVDSRLARRHQGTGLGLPLTKALIEMHGGALDLASEVGVGTTVSVRFPGERILPAPSTAA